MSQGLPNPTGSEEPQRTPAPVTDPPSQSASNNAEAVLKGATGFAAILHEDERLIGGILISIPVLLTALIPFIPEKQRFTLACLTLGSVLVMGLLIFLLIKYRQRQGRQNVVENEELRNTNTDLQSSKSELEKQLRMRRDELRDSTKEQRAFLFRLKSQANQIAEQVEVLLQSDKITNNEVRETNRQMISLTQQIQDALDTLQRVQGSLSDAEDLDAIDPSFERELMERFERKQ